MIRLGIVGVGSFAQYFIPLFHAHPLVEQVALCDLDAEKLAATAQHYGIAQTFSSLEAACASDLDALVLMTQNWLHGPQAVQALQAGKDVYSAVPAGISVEEIQTLVQTVTETGRIYMMGETSYYHPAVVYCRQRYQAGDFGPIVYGEADYYHDWDHGLYEVFRQRGGAHWLETAGIPPMYYPTHSTSQIIAVTGAYMTHVSCQGFVDTAADGIYAAAANRWGNRFSNETALFAMSDGSCCRVNEFRRVGHPEAERLTGLFGTQASFEANAAGARWLTKMDATGLNLDDLLVPTGQQTAQGTYHELAAVHDVTRLPQEFAGLPNGHAGAHQFLVDDFVQACVTRTLPPIHVWAAARYTIPGIVAHASAVRGGERLPIPDCGDPPKVDSSLH